VAVAFFPAPPAFPRIESVKAWLFAIARNRTLNAAFGNLVIAARSPASRVFRLSLLDRVALRGLLLKWRRDRGEGRHANRDTARWRRRVAVRRLPGGPPG
jgi:DNA-directed RNA polymerase specialized sigma24 family protein